MQSRAVAKQLSQDLSDIGIEVSLDNAHLSILDLFRNAFMDEPFPCYHSVFSRLEGKRQQKKEYGTTFLWGNSQWSFNAYDKKIEMALRKSTTLPPQDNVIRAECQFKRAKLKSLKLCTLSDLWREFENLPSIYVSLVKKTLFHLSIKDADVLGARSTESEMLLYQNSHRRNWPNQYIQDAGLAYLANRLERKPQSVHLRKFWEPAKETRLIQDVSVALSKMYTPRLSNSIPCVRRVPHQEL